VIDYGCGAGEIVNLLRARGFDAYGCDVFYEGGDYSKIIGANLLGTVIRRIDGHGRIPFDDASFDFVINNQVMEHVESLEVVLAEIARVLKPGGQVLSLFPDKGVWREGHCGIPFLHWFPKSSGARIYYAAALRAAGLGYNKGDKTVMQWSEDFCNWLDRWTHYRTSQEIDSTYGKYFATSRSIEGDWLKARLDRRAALAAALPTGLQAFVVKKLAGRVFVVSGKHAA
jgi:SAM-dependent methyltransferase